MNPNIDRNTLMAVDHHDYTHSSGLALDHFHPDSGAGTWLIVGAIAVAVAGVALYWGGDMSYKIAQKKDCHAVYAAGFYQRERAEAWLARYNPQHWTDKTVQRDDLEIIEEARKGRNDGQ